MWPNNIHQSRAIWHTKCGRRDQTCRCTDWNNTQHGDGASISASSERLCNTARRVYCTLFRYIYIDILYKFFFARVPLTVTVPLENKNLHSAGLHGRINYTVRNVYKNIYTHTQTIICETPFIHRGNETEGVRRESGSIINFDNEFKEKSRKKKNYKQLKRERTRLCHGVPEADGSKRRRRDPRYNYPEVHDP